MSIFSKFDLSQLRDKLRKNVINRSEYPKKLFQFLDNFNIIGSHESKNEINYIWSGTQAEYDEISSPQDDTLYFIE